MKPYLVSLTLLVMLSLPGPGSYAADACDSDGNIQFICGPVSPEDLVAIPDSPWVVVSSMVNEGHLYIADKRNHSTTLVFPTAAAKIVPDTAAYGACPGPLTSEFRPHGLNVRPGTNGHHTLYVVAHGGREAVEVFTVDVNGLIPILTWVGCVIAPDDVSLNSVTSLPGGGFATTNFNIQEGQLWEWHPVSGWAEVPGSTMAGPNGIVSSPDGRWFYIGGWSSDSLVRLSRGREPVQRAMVHVGFHIDNVRWAPDGSLLVAGQHGFEMESLGGCMSRGECDEVSSRVARVDPDTLMVEPLINYPSNDKFIFGTVALQVGDEIWFGGIAGGNRIARFPF
ncbi:MAG: hypothetical protein JKY98_09055 [Gammaproteobacteria bacterium]|nr:hypothetical protein [Gammaproteobacteria bacterium]